MNYLKINTRIALVLILSTAVFSQPKWTWVAPKPTGNTLRCVQSPDGINVFAVGDGGTIIKSTDGGETWNLMYSDADYFKTYKDSYSRFLSFYGVYFINPKKGFAAGVLPEGGINTKGILLTTNDGGTTWSNIDLNTEVELTSISFINDKVGFVSGFYENYLGTSSADAWETTDGGKTWSIVNQLENYEANQIVFADTSTGYAIGAGFIAKTTDGGKNWVFQNIPSIGGLNSISLINKDTAFSVGYGGNILYTHNGGKNWYQIVGVTNDDLWGVSFANNNLGYIIGPSGKVIKTTDGGQSWDATNLEYGSVYYYWNIATINKNKTIIVGNFGQIFTTTDNGITWNLKTKNAPPFPGGYNGIQFVNPHLGFASGAGTDFSSSNSSSTGLLLRTTDGGVNWQSIFSPNSGLKDCDAIFFTDSLTGYLGVSSDTTLIGLFKTTDGGNNWLPVQNYTGSEASYILFLSDSVGFVGDWGGNIYRTTDGGYTWYVAIDSSNGSRFNLGQFVTSIQFVNDSLGYAGGNGLIKTTNGGRTWFQTTTSISNYRIVGLSFINDSVGFAATWYGELLKTINGGKTWIAGYYQSPDNDMIGVKFFNNNLGYVFGYRGIAKTTDGGNTWSNYWSTPGGNQINTVCFIDSTQFYAAGDPFNIFKGEFSDSLQDTSGISNINENIEAIPKDFILSQNYPNPFNPSTTINYSIPKTSFVTIKLYNTLGEEISTLVNEEKSAGSFSIKFSAASKGLASGIYFYRMQAVPFSRQAGKFEETKKLLFLK